MDNEKTIRRAESEQKSYQERKDLMEHFNDSTRTFNFTKNQAKRDYSSDVVLAKKLNIRSRKKFVD